MGKSKKNREVNSKELIGKRILYLGLLGASKSCIYCGKSKRKGMFSEFKNEFYCNDDCIKMSGVI